MGLLPGLLQGVVDIAATPIVAAQDLLECGKNNRTAKHVNKIGEDIEEMFSY